MTPQTIEVHIEELVLHGFAPGDRYAIGEAVQGELTRLFTTQGVPAPLSAGAEVGRVDAGAFPVGAGAQTEGVGTGAARAVYGGLGG